MMSSATPPEIALTLLFGIFFLKFSVSAIVPGLREDVMIQVESETPTESISAKHGIGLG
jgi:hypothetical protein